MPLCRIKRKNETVCFELHHSAHIANMSWIENINQSRFNPSLKEEMTKS